MSLYRKYRPKSLDEVIGQDMAVSILSKKMKDNSLPNTIMLSGPTGVGKSTLAGIIADSLGCSEMNINSINCADVRGIETVREIRDVMYLAPMGGKCRVWKLEEVVQLPKLTQQGFLEILENTPPRVYFILCTSDTTGLLPTFMGRCFHIALESLSIKDIRRIVSSVLECENARTLDGVVMTAITTHADGSARKALQLLEACLPLKTVDDQLKAVNAASVEQAEKPEFLARLLLRRAEWSEVCMTLKTIEDKDVETIRRQVLAYVGKGLIENWKAYNKALACVIINYLEDSIAYGGRAALAKRCYYICTGKT